MVDIREELREYPYILEDIQKLHKEMEDTLRMKRETQDTLKAQVISDMPRSGEISDPTVKAVIKSIDRFDVHLDFIARSISFLYDKKERLEKALQTLTVKEFRMVDEFFFKGYRMEIIEIHLHYSRTHAYRICQEAVDKLTMTRKQDATR